MSSYHLRKITESCLYYKHKLIVSRWDDNTSMNIQLGRSVLGVSIEHLGSATFRFKSEGGSTKLRRSRHNWADGIQGRFLGNGSFSMTETLSRPSFHRLSGCRIGSEYGHYLQCILPDRFRLVLLSVSTS